MAGDRRIMTDKLDTPYSIIKIYGKPCRLFHRWVCSGDKVGKTTYSVCKDCKARKVEQVCGGYQPIDWDFFDR